MNSRIEGSLQLYGAVELCHSHCWAAHKPQTFSRPAANCSWLEMLILVHFSSKASERCASAIVTLLTGHTSEICVSAIHRQVTLLKDVSQPLSRC